MHKPAALSVLSVLLTGLGVLFANCSHDNGSIVGGGNGTPQTMTMTGTFRATADTLYVTMIMPPDTYSYCMGDSLWTSIDSGQTSTESGIRYSLSSNTLTLLFTEVSSSSYVVEEISTMSRVGSGTGIQGTWALSSTAYSVISGMLPDTTRHRLDSTVAATNATIASGTESFRLTLSGTRFIEEISYSFSRADYYVENWTTCDPLGYSLDTCSYAVTVTKAGDNMVQLLGRTSHETVTITWDAANNQTYLSSDTSHHPYVYYLNPTSCPDDPSPSWFITFLTANSKILTGTLTKQAFVPQDRHKAALMTMKKFLFR